MHDGYSREMRQVLRYMVVGTILICGVGFGDAVLQPSPPPPGRLLASLRAPRCFPLPASSHLQVYYPGTPALWWGSRWLRAGPVRSLPRNRGGNRRRPREVEALERVVSPAVEVTEEGYGHRGERSSRLYRGGGCESRELDRQLVHDPDRLLFQGFRFPVRTPVRRDEAVFSIPRVSNPSLSLSLSHFPILIFRHPFFSIPISLVFHSFLFANRCLSLARVATFGRTSWRTSCACDLYGSLRVSSSSSSPSCSPVFVITDYSRSHPARVKPGTHDAR